MRLKSATGVWGRPADLQKRLDMRSPSKWFTIRPKSLTASCCASSFPSPTIQRELNRQGPDVGTSYRSAIFYVNDDQRRIANTYIAHLDTAKVFPARIVTEVMPLKGFYRAEDYHQDYALHLPENPYIQVCDRPRSNR